MTCEKCGAVTADPVAVFVDVRDYETPRKVKYQTELCVECLIEVAVFIGGEEVKEEAFNGGATTG